VGVLALALAVWMGMKGTGRIGSLPEEMGIAVLPFTTTGSGAGSPISPEGLVEMIASELAQLERYEGALWVASTSEVRAQEIAGPVEAGRVLGVSFAVTGSVAQEAERVVLRLNLEDARTGQRRDAKTIEAPLTDLNTLQGAAVAVLAQMLEVELQPEARRAIATGGTQDAEAFGAYVRGLGMLERNTEEALLEAVALFRQALDEDPGFALAHAQLADACLGLYDETRGAVWVERAERAVEQAIALDPGAPQGYVAPRMPTTRSGRRTRGPGRSPRPRRRTARP
jgi:TolB-like protein